MVGGVYLRITHWDPSELDRVECECDRGLVGYAVGRAVGQAIHRQAVTWVRYRMAQVL